MKATWLRGDLWEQISQAKLTISTRDCLIGGDFNEIRRLEEQGEEDLIKWGLKISMMQSND